MKRIADDDSSEPQTTTPARVADRVDRLAAKLVAIAGEFHSLGGLIDDQGQHGATSRTLSDLAFSVCHFAVDVRFGRVPLCASVVDRDAGRGARPLLDQVERNGPKVVHPPERPGPALNQPAVQRSNGVAESVPADEPAEPAPAGYVRGGLWPKAEPIPARGQPKPPDEETDEACPREPDVALDIHRQVCPKGIAEAKALAVPTPPSKYVAVVGGKGPLYVIEADSLYDARQYAESQHSAGARLDVRPWHKSDDKRKLPVFGPGQKPTWSEYEKAQSFVASKPTPTPRSAEPIPATPSIDRLDAIPRAARRILAREGVKTITELAHAVVKGDVDRMPGMRLAWGVKIADACQGHTREIRALRGELADGDDAKQAAVEAGKPEDKPAGSIYEISLKKRMGTVSYGEVAGFVRAADALEALDIARPKFKQEISARRVERVPDAWTAKPMIGSDVAPDRAEALAPGPGKWRVTVRKASGFIVEQLGYVAGADKTAAMHAAVGWFGPVPGLRVERDGESEQLDPEPAKPAKRGRGRPKKQAAGVS